MHFFFTVFTDMSTICVSPSNKQITELDQMLDNCDFQDIRDPKYTNTSICSNLPAYLGSVEEVQPSLLQ
jgi:hypothetical protein